MHRILIVGLGSIGQRHCGNFRALGGVELALLRRGPYVGQEYAGIPVFTGLEQALNWQPDLAMICTPTAFHLDSAIPIASAGVNLFLEKPVSHSWDRIDQLRTLQSKTGRLVVVGYDLRFDLGLRKVQELLAEGVIGRPLVVRAEVGQYLPDWRPNQDYTLGVSARRDLGGGVLLELTHEFDYLLWLFGDIAEVGCFSGHLSSLAIETEDVAVVNLAFGNGMLGNVALDYIQRQPTRILKVVGERGTILWDGLDRVTRWSVAGERHSHAFDYKQQDRNARFMAEAGHLVACLQGKESPLVDLEEGLRSLAVAIAAIESSVRQAVVRVHPS
jgi:predicted dehydrogenase